MILMGLIPLWVQVFCIYLRFGHPCNNIYAIEHVVTGEFCFSIGYGVTVMSMVRFSGVCHSPCVRDWYMSQEVELYSSLGFYV